MLLRAWIVTLCLLASAAVLARASKSEPVPPRASLATFPMQIGAWQGRPAPRFELQVVTLLGVDEFVNRLYSMPGHHDVSLYIGYYRSQRQGDTMHSPLNCLPGAGWEPIKRERIEIPVSPHDTAARRVVVNRILIQKGMDRQLVIYWYQSHGRVIASEYLGKVYTVLDAVRMNRTDAAMVRVIAPVEGSGGGGEQVAAQTAIDFTRAMLPFLDRYLPG